MSTLVEKAEALAMDVACTEDELRVVLSDGRTVAVPLAWFPRLVGASAKQRAGWELISRRAPPSVARAFLHVAQDRLCPWTRPRRPCYVRLVDTAKMAVLRPPWSRPRWPCYVRPVVTANDV